MQRPHTAIVSHAPGAGKAIRYDRATRDFAMYLDGELVGFARTRQEAERTLDELVYELLQLLPPPLEGGDADEVVEQAA